MKLSASKALLLGGIAGAGLAAIVAYRKRGHNIAGQVVLITGGSRGLGLAMVREFAKYNCRIAICARDASELAKAEEMMRNEGIEISIHVCDVSDQAQVRQMVEAVCAWHGQIDILVNNAGEILVAPFEDTTVADFERAMAVMFWGPLYTTLSVLPQMRVRGSGRIAVIASIGGKVSVPHLVAYSCAKFAAVALFEGLRAELAESGIRVTTIAPGLMRTGSHVNARFKGDHKKEFAWFSAAASLPLVSMSAERAAAQAVDAIRCGTAEKILSTQANLMVGLQGALPGLLPEILSVVNRVLPSATATGSEAEQGVLLARNQNRLLRLLTTLGSNTGARLNQPSI